MIAWRRRMAASCLVVTLAAGAQGALTACSGSAAGQVDYIVDGALDTYNTNTVSGAASAGAQAFARTLTGFGYHGPDGQVVADHDFGAISLVGGSPLVLDYQIADNAVYSDGKPVTCDDLVLTWAAQSGRFPASTPPARRATSTSRRSIANRGRRKRGCRSPLTATSSTTTSCSPRPRSCRRMSLPTSSASTSPAALLGNNGPVIARIAQLWNTTWNLKPGTDSGVVAKHFPSTRAVQDRIGIRRWRSGSRRQRQMVGHQADDQAGHGLAAESRHPGPGQRQERRRRRRSRRLVGCPGHTRHLPPHRRGGRRHRAADLRAERTATSTSRPAARWRCAPRAT